jgi:voltage-gated potassium channel
MTRLARRFLIIGLAIAGTLLIGTVGFTVIEHYPPFDAFYMTLTTMTTVGYAELHPLSRAGRIFNSFLIFFGVTTIFIAIGAMTQTIIELEFGDAIGQRRNKKMIDKLKDHFIICGFGRVGRGAAAELQHAGAPFVVVDISPERVERAMQAGMLAVAADSTHDETLRQVGIERAAGLVAALATDADNLFVLLSAKGLNPRIYVATRAAEEGAEEKMRRAGADAVFAPYVITGHRLAQSLLRPHVVQFLDFTTKDIGEDIAIEQVCVSEASEVASRTIREMQLGRDVGVIVMAIRKRDGQMLFNPPADTAVHGGEYLIVMGRQENLRTLETLIAGPRRSRRT